jgi:hypothetical protein
MVETQGVIEKPTPIACMHSRVRKRNWNFSVAIDRGIRSLCWERKEKKQRPLSGCELRGSVDVLATQETIDHLADRIERAYSLRRPAWNRGCSTRRVWAAAALRLWQAHANDPTLPLDCELFVGCQPITGSLGDPWVELTQVGAARRYRTQVRRIVRRLRRELKREIQRAERILSQSLRLTFTSLSQDRRLSPLGCYIAAQRMGRPDIADQFTLTAVDQHRACPLYQSASRTLLPVDLYPAAELRAPQEMHGVRTFKKSIVMN